MTELETKTEKEFKAIPRFNDHGKGCSNHANHMLDCDYTKKEDRDLMISILDRLILQAE